MPTFSAQQTLTDNRELSSTNRQSDLVTQLSPGFGLSSNAGRVRGTLNYALNQIWYATDTQRNTVQNALQANLTAEAIENHGFVDATASVSQQTISAFGTQSAGTGLVNSNSTEVSTLSLTPSWRSRLGGWADLNASLNWTGTHSASTSLGNQTAHGGNVGLSGRHGLFGWGLTASRQVSDYTQGRATTTDQGVATLSFYPDPEVQLSANVGRQAQDVLTTQREWITTSGWSAAWQPTDRTQIAYQDSRSYYGRSHNLSFSHRMARSVWTYSDTRGVAGSPSPQGSATPLTLYDLFYNICLQGGGDAASCNQSVQTQLAQQGLNPGTVYGGGFLNSGLTLQRSQDLSVAVSGVRTTITVSAYRTDTRPLGATSSSGDLASVTDLRQQGYSLTVSQRLTPTASLNATASTQKTLDAGPQAGNAQQLYLLSWVDNLGPHTNVTLTARHTVFDSPTAPYRESALIGALGLRF